MSDDKKHEHCFGDDCMRPECWGADECFKDSMKSLFWSD